VEGRFNSRKLDALRSNAIFISSNYMLLINKQKQKTKKNKKQKNKKKLFIYLSFRANFKGGVLKYILNPHSESKYHLKTSKSGFLVL